MRKRSIVAALAVATGLIAGTATPSGAADTAPTLSGPGWKISTQYGVQALDPNLGYTVTFMTQTAKDHWAPYIARVVDQYQALGIPLTIGGVEPRSTQVCPPAGRILVVEMHDPNKPGYSQGIPCADSKGVARGGMVRMDTAYNDGTWYLSEKNRFNIPSHELTHAMGLTHSNSDVNGNGKVEDQETVKNTDGTSPLMVGPAVGGYATKEKEGTLTPLDIDGINTLKANFPLVNGS
jgi:hypothetical protein